MTATNEADKRVEIPSEITSLYYNWLRLHRAWWSAHYLIGSFGIAAAVIAGSKAVDTGMPDSIRVAISAFAAVATSLVTFLGPIQRAERYWKAWHLLDQAIVEYRTGQIDMKRFTAYAEMGRRIVLEAPNLHVDNRRGSQLNEAMSMNDEQNDPKAD